jgi:hypothetical protein
MKILDVEHIVKSIEGANLCFDCERTAVGVLIDLLGRPLNVARFDWPERDRYMREWGGLS